MPAIEFEDGAVQIDATIIAEGLGIEPALVQARMREGRIAIRHERATVEDAGRPRLTYFAAADVCL